MYAYSIWEYAYSIGNHICINLGVQSTMYTVQCTVYIVQCTMYIVYSTYFVDIKNNGDLLDLLIYRHINNFL